jgi:hypothetical protein
MAIDFTKAPDEVIVQLINEENSRHFTVADLDLTNIAIAPDPVSNRPAFNNVRTSLSVAAAALSGYTGDVTIKYNRVAVRQVFPTEDPEDTRYPNSSDSYQLGERVNLIDLLAEINAKYSINIRPVDIFDMPLPQFEGPPPYDPAYVRLEMQGTSKVFLGGINLRILPNDWDLGEMQYSEMNGLTYPSYAAQPPGMATWQEVGEQLDLMQTPGYW